MTSKDIPAFMLVSLLITVIQWFYRLRHAPKKERAAYLSILALCWILAISLVINPRLPGPSQLVNYLFHPLGQLLEH